MERVSFLGEDDNKILFINFAGCMPSEAIKVMEEAMKVIAQQPFYSVRTLTDVSGARYNREAVVKLKQFVSHNKPYVKAGAVVGLSPLQKIVLEAVSRVSQREFKVFSNAEEAKTWLSER